MKFSVKRVRLQMLVLLCVSIIFGFGCDDGTVRGAGSIDVPKDKLKTYPRGKVSPARKDNPSAVR
jgi:hypothetical protein